MLIDSHCHLNRLDLSKYQDDLNLALQAAKAEGVERILCVCVELEDFPAIISITEQYNFVQASVGLHPTESVQQEPTQSQLTDLARHSKVLAIGETGLDYYRCEGDMEWQRQRFRNHIGAARAVQKPLIIHTRQAAADTLHILREEKAEAVGGVFHCFTEDWEVAKQALDIGFYISFSGIITFNNAKALQEVVKQVPLARILIETDAPYLAPVPHRGKPNEPAYVRYVAQSIAQLKNTDFETVAAKTSANFCQLFQVKENS
ncbi:MAG TPA: TatD family hydrolase [Gammaproteobacteria bacterium]|nr:TatD family hydrolase [Gammaproteobacteria bacterium]